MWKNGLFFYKQLLNEMSMEHTKLSNFVIFNNNAFKELVITFGFDSFCFVYVLTTGFFILQRSTQIVNFTVSILRWFTLSTFFSVQYSKTIYFLFTECCSLCSSKFKLFSNCSMKNLYMFKMQLSQIELAALVYRIFEDRMENWKNKKKSLNSKKKN